MACPTDKTLFQAYINATMEYFEASDRLVNLVGQHEEFAKAQSEEIIQIPEQFW